MQSKEEMATGKLPVAIAHTACLLRNNIKPILAYDGFNGQTLDPLLLMKPFVDFFDLFRAAATTTITAASIFLVKPDPAFPDPGIEQTSHSVGIHVEMQGNIVQRCDLSIN